MEHDGMEPGMDATLKVGNYVSEINYDIIKYACNYKS